MKAFLTYCFTFYDLFVFFVSIAPEGKVITNMLNTRQFMLSLFIIHAALTQQSEENVSASNSDEIKGRRVKFVEKFISSSRVGMEMKSVSQSNELFGQSLYSLLRKEQGNLIWS